ncbi:MAG: ROK family protein [Acidimicrobiaceae bacterium]|nr:ROK family protein [Acidimicrobiaceae bacterium]MYD06569.1 ROK family protein [Acidimicrobiaceae bacterium]MYI57484.1 ROK family protein [Acidimicrobiaceae bacterium]
MRQASDSRLLRLVNGQRIVDALLASSPGGISRADVARVTGLSKPTVSLLVGDLEQSGLVRLASAARSSGGVGRPAALYEIVPEAGMVIAVDIGATKVIVGLADLLGRVVAEREIETGPDAASALTAIVGHVEEMLADADGAAKAACIGVPGVYRRETDVVERALNLPGFEGLHVQAMAEDLLGVEVHIDNDVNLAALGEADNADDGFEPTNFAAISVGTGIGMGLVVDGDLYRGGTHAVGEIGSLILSGGDSDSNSIRTLEDLASANAIRKSFAVAIEEGHPSSLEGTPDVPAIFEAADLGDPGASHVLSVAARAMALAVSHLGFITDPERVIFGGGVGANQVFVRAVESELAHLMPSPPVVAASTLGRRATFLGAVSRALESLHETLVTQHLGEQR